MPTARPTPRPTRRPIPRPTRRPMPRPARRPIPRPAVEPLEPRRLLAAAPLAIDGSGFDGASAVAATGDGGVVVAGLFADTVDFAPGRARVLATAVGDTDAFVAKYGPGGDLAWVRTFGGDTSERPLRDLDRRDFPINPDRLGTFATLVGTDPEDAGEHVLDLAVGPDGDVYAVGTFRNTVDFARGVENPGRNPAGRAGWTFRAGSGTNFGGEDFYDAYTLRLDGDTGRPVYAATVSGPFNDVATSVAVDRFGDAVVGGYYTRFADFNPNAHSQNIAAASGRDDAFLTRLSVRGRTVWTSRLGSDTVGPSDREAVADLALSPDGSLVYAGGTVSTDEGAYFVAGPTDRTRERDGDRLPEPPDNGQSDGYLAAIDHDTGELVWYRTAIAGGSADGISRVAVAPDGSVYTAGYFQEDALAARDGGLKRFEVTRSRRDRRRELTDLVVQKFEGGRDGGRAGFAERLAGNGYELAGDLVAGDDGVTLAGSYFGTLDLDVGPGVASVTSVRGADNFRRDRNTRDTRDLSYDGFLVALGPQGAYRAGSTFGGNGDDFLAGVAVTAPGTFAAVGLFGRQTDDPFGDTITVAAGPFAPALGLESNASEAALILRMLDGDGYVG